MMSALTIRISRPSSQRAHCCRVGMVDTGAATAITVTLADAVPPVPPSTEVTAPVVLFFVPAVVPCTFSDTVHEVLPASVAPDRLTDPAPATAVVVPVQVVVKALGVATSRPAGNVSVKLTPVKAAATLGLLRVKVSEVAPFSAMLAAPKA